MPTPFDDDEEADYPNWLGMPTQKFQAIQAEGKASDKLICLAAFLLCAAECEGIFPPEVRVTHEGHIRLTWNVKDRGASLEVRPSVQLQITKWNDEEIVHQQVYQDGQISRVRDVITWLFPAANAVAMAELL